MDTLFVPQKLYTSEEIEKASYNELRKMAKEAHINVGRGCTTAQYRLSLMEQALQPEQVQATLTTSDVITLKDLTVGDRYSFGKAVATYIVVDTDETGIKIANEKGQTWWERKLDRVVNRK